MGFCLEGHRNLVGRFVLEHFPPLNVQTGVVSDEDRAEILEAAKKEAIEKVRGNKNRSARTDSTMIDEARRWKNPSGSADQTAG
jgi:hypothetical protein